MDNPDLQKGDPAPQFEATAVGGEYGDGAQVSLVGFRGQTVVLYFYPKNDTPGCTTQACGLRDSWDQISAKAKLFGVSVDPAESHRKFIAKHSLPFPLLSDDSREIVKKYGVWVEKERDGEKFMGTERTTFVIGPDQKIKAILPKVNPADHADQLLDLLPKEPE